MCEQASSHDRNRWHLAISPQSVFNTALLQVNTLKYETIEPGTMWQISTCYAARKSQESFKIHSLSLSLPADTLWFSLYTSISEQLYYNGITLFLIYLLGLHRPYLWILIYLSVCCRRICQTYNLSLFVIIFSGGKKSRITLCFLENLPLRPNCTDLVWQLHSNAFWMRNTIKQTGAELSPYSITLIPYQLEQQSDVIVMYYNPLEFSSGWIYWSTQAIT